MTVRFHITFAAGLALILGAAPRASAQVDLFIAQIVDGGLYTANSSFFTDISVYNPGGNTTSCTFSTFDNAGNPLDLVYVTPSAAATASARRRTRPVPKSATAPASSLQFTIPPEGTTTLETSGGGDGSNTALEGGAELNCSDFVIGGATYWLATSSDIVTGIGVPAVDPTTAFRVAGGNESTAFAFYNPSQANSLDLTIEAYDGDTGALVDSATMTVDPNGHTAFNANQVLSLPSPFYGSFRVPDNGQQFVPLVLGVTNTNANDVGFTLYTIPSLSGAISGIDVKQIRR